MISKKELRVQKRQVKKQKRVLQKSRKNQRKTGKIKLDDRFIILHSFISCYCFSYFYYRKFADSSYCIS